MSSNIEIKKKCLWCGSEFIARKTSTEYCSHRCSGLAYKERKRQAKLEAYKKEYASLSSETKMVEEIEFLTPTQCAKLLGVSRRSLYNYLSVNSIPCLQLKGKTLIGRNHLDKLFDGRNEYKGKQRSQRAEITEFYTSKEVQEKFGISNSALYEIANRENWPKTQSRGKTLWSRKHVDAYFNRIKPDENISEWYTASEIQEKFGMTLSAIYNVVSKEGIPKKKEKGATFYSKLHFDKAKGIEVDDTPQYYTYPEAMEKYNMTRDQLHHYLKYHNITRTKKGKYTLISRKELDDLFAPPSI